jgi:hypothetical protein
VTALAADSSGRFWVAGLASDDLPDGTLRLTRPRMFAPQRDPRLAVARNALALRLEQNTRHRDLVANTEKIGRRTCL